MLVTKEVDRFNMQGTTSFTVLSVLFDALQAALIEETGFQSEQFALIHPGGAVGAPRSPFFLHFDEADAGGAPLCL